jgi:hypothetical protein
MHGHYQGVHPTRHKGGATNTVVGCCASSLSNCSRFLTASLAQLKLDSGTSVSILYIPSVYSYIHHITTNRALTVYQQANRRAS